MCHSFKSVIASLGINIENMKVQNYDRAFNMLGLKSRVGPRLQEEHPSALHDHCLFHSLNLSMSSINSASPSMKDIVDSCIEMMHLLKCIPKRKRILDKIALIGIFN